MGSSVSNAPLILLLLLLQALLLASTAVAATSNSRWQYIWPTLVI
jgi:hypothetical protein